MRAYSTMVASHGGIASGECTPSMNQNADSSYSRRSSLNTDEYAYRSCHPSAPGGVGISNGLGNRSAMMFLLERAAAGHRGRRIIGDGLATALWRAGLRAQQGLHHAGDRVRGAGRGLSRVAAPDRRGAALQQQHTLRPVDGLGPVDRPLHVLRALVVLLRPPGQGGHGMDLVV